jgi:hypothetical protein
MIDSVWHIQLVITGATGYMAAREARKEEKNNLLN